MASGSAPTPSSEGMTASTPLYVAGPKGRLQVDGEYDPEITPEIDKVIRNMRVVVERCNEQAHQLRRETGSENFEVVLSYRESQQRPRAYVCPKNSKGIHEELSQAVLLKAALGMAGR